MVDENYVYARLGKRMTKRIRTAPEDGFKSKDIEDWPGCDLFINLSDEKISGKTKDNGQIIAMQVNNVDVKYRLSVLQKFTDIVNKDISCYGLHLTINSIPSNKAHFWNVVTENKGKIKKVILSYTPPNLLDLKSSLEEDLKKASEEFNSTKVQIVLENNEGKLDLPQNNKLLQESAEYVDLGAGSFKLLLSGKKKAISSEDNIKTKNIYDIDLIYRSSEMTKEQLNKIMIELLRGKS